MRLYGLLLLLLLLLLLGVVQLPGSCSDESPHTQDWHKTKATQKLLLDFHLAKARFPKKAVSRAHEVHEKVMRDIQKRLQKIGEALRFEFAGSSYEGIKVGSTDMEFDVMVVLPGGELLKDEVVKPGWAKLKPASNRKEFTELMTSSLYIDPEKATAYFFGVLQKAINYMPEYNEIIHVRQHGPAIQMDVFDNQSSRHLLYSVDMVPAYQLGNLAVVKEGIYYVAKPFKGDISDGKSWRRSFALQEKDKLKTIDVGGKCRKQCIRIFKVLRDSEPGLHAIVSYWLKTSIFNLDRDQPQLDWSQANLRLRFFDMVTYLADALEEGVLRHYFLPEVNLVEDLTGVQRSNIYTRLRGLVRKEEQFKTAINRALGEEKARDEL